MFTRKSRPLFKENSISMHYREAPAAGFAKQRFPVQTGES